MLAQGELGFKYEVEHQGEGMPGMERIGPYLDLACRSGMVRSIERHVSEFKKPVLEVGEEDSGLPIVLDMLQRIAYL